LANPFIAANWCFINKDFLTHFIVEAASDKQQLKAQMQ
jgi:hypothetical protein